MKTNYHLLNSKLFFVLMLHHTTISEMWPPLHEACCHQDNLPMAQHCATGSCSRCWGMCLLTKHLSVQANITTGCVPYLMCSSGFPQWTPSAFLQETADDGSHTRLAQAELLYSSAAWTRGPSYSLETTTFYIFSHALLHLQIRGYISELENRETDSAFI